MVLHRFPSFNVSSLYAITALHRLPLILYPFSFVCDHDPPHIPYFRVSPLQNVSDNGHSQIPSFNIMYFHFCRRFKLTTRSILYVTSQPDVRDHSYPYIAFFNVTSLPEVSDHDYQQIAFFNATSLPDILDHAYPRIVFF